MENKRQKAKVGLMEYCEGLAATGVDSAALVSTAIFLICIAALFLFRKKIKSLYVAASFVMAFTVVMPGTITFAAPVECPLSAPDTSTGAVGEVQIYNVLTNDTPTTGSTFVLDSLRLALVENPVEGSVLSDDARKVTAPTEGEYLAGTNGTITFTPQATFTGKTRGVLYSIADTAGNRTSNSYIPMVVAAIPSPEEPKDNPPVAACTEFDEGIALRDRSATIYYGSVSPTSLTYSYGSHSSYVSRDGTHIVYSQDGRLMYSSDRGVSWSESDVDASGFRDIVGSADGSRLVAYNSTSIYTSIDYGATWVESETASLAGDGVWLEVVVISGDGSMMYAVQSTGGIYASSDRGVTWNSVELGANYRIASLDVSYDGSVLIAGGRGVLYVSVDGGANWESRTSQASIGPSSTVEYVDINDAGTKMLIKQRSTPGLYQSNDLGQNWTDIAGSQQLTPARVSSDGDTIIAASTDGDHLIGTNSGSSWAGLGYYPNNYDLGSVSEDGSVVVWYEDGGMVVNVSNNYGQSHTSYEYPAIDARYIDIDPATEGIQRTIDKTETEGWRAEYDHEYDSLVIDITDFDLFTGAAPAYTVTAPGCVSPAPARISLSEVFDV